MSVIDNSIIESTDTSDISIDIQSTDDGILPPINSNEGQKVSPRRPDIDIIRITLTWGILLFHTVVMFTPYFPYYSKILPDEVEYWHLLLTLTFSISMNVWNMPMFFFLSGISAFFALIKRSEKQFRLERIHRLLAPALFLSLVSSFGLTADFASKLSPNCEEYYLTGHVSKKENATDGIDWNYCAMFYKFTKNDSYLDHLRSMYKPVPSPSQGWFLCYLFFYTQILAHLFIEVHPNHKENVREQKCFKRPFSKLAQIICCLNFFGYLAPNNEIFLNAVKFWLGHPLKLVLVPSVWIGLVELALRSNFPDGQLWFFGFLFDHCNNIKFIFIFVIGFGITAADDYCMRDIIKKGRWFYFIIGILNLFLYSSKFIYENSYPELKLLFFFWRGFAEWIFIIGVYGVFREVFTKSYSWLSFLSELAMPFYLTHQQVLIPIAAGASWMNLGYIGSFSFVLTLSTIGTLLISWIITKSGSLRYFFGLSSVGDSWLPGKPLNGCIPVVVMSILFVVIALLANFA